MFVQESFRKCRKLETKVTQELKLTYLNLSKIELLIFQNTPDFV